jgi:hypothetical protein
MLVLFLLTCVAVGAAIIDYVETEQLRAPKSTVLRSPPVGPDGRVEIPKGWDAVDEYMKVQIVCCLALIPVAFVVPCFFLNCSRPLRGVVCTGCWMAGIAGLVGVLLSQKAPLFGGGLSGLSQFSAQRLGLMPGHVILFLLAGLMAGCVLELLIPGDVGRVGSDDRQVRGLPKPPYQPIKLVTRKPDGHDSPKPATAGSADDFLEAISVVRIEK